MLAAGLPLEASLEAALALLLFTPALSVFGTLCDILFCGQCSLAPEPCWQMCTYSAPLTSTSMWKRIISEFSCARDVAGCQLKRQAEAAVPAQQQHQQHGEPAPTHEGDPCPPWIQG